MLSLPNELLFMVFENLGYWELRINLPMVCKRFKSIIDYTSPIRRGKIDSILFRELPTNSTPTSTVYRTHPIFSLLEFRGGVDSVENIYIRRPEGSSVEPVRLVDSPARFENAVSPGRWTLRCKVGERELPAVWSKGKGSSTVLEVMEVLVRARTKKVWSQSTLERTLLGWTGIMEAKVVETTTGWNFVKLFINEIPAPAEEKFDEDEDGSCPVS